MLKIFSRRMHIGLRYRAVTTLFITLVSLFSKSMASSQGILSGEVEDLPIVGNMALFESTFSWNLCENATCLSGRLECKSVGFILTELMPVAKRRGEAVVHTRLSFFQGENMDSIRIFYDAEGDILDIIFSFSEPENRTGFELNENIVIFTDKEINRALGMTFISYSRLLIKDSVKLDFLTSFPLEEQKRLLKIISSEPVKHFLRVIIPLTNQVAIESPSLKELIKAA